MTNLLIFWIFCGALVVTIKAQLMPLKASEWKPTVIFFLLGPLVLALMIFSLYDPEGVIYMLREWNRKMQDKINTARTKKTSVEAQESRDNPNREED